MTVSFIFPGQGSQYIGMGKDLYDNFPISREIFDKAEAILDLPIKEYCFNGPAEVLKKTVICQPAIFVTSIAALSALQSKLPIFPAYVLGLSLGEYSALVAAKVLKFEDALYLVKKRAELMEEEAKKSQGAMWAVIGLDRDILQDICRELKDVYIANLNTADQIVLSGLKEKTEALKKLCLEKGAKKVIELEVSGAFHSPFMREASERFKEFLKEVDFSFTQIPLVSNVDAQPKTEPEQIKEALIRQIYSSVFWEDAVKFVISKGVTSFYEIGAGKVLKGLIRKINPGVEVINIESAQDIVRLF